VQHFAVSAKKGNAMAACELLLKYGADPMVRRASGARVRAGTTDMEGPSLLRALHALAVQAACNTLRAGHTLAP
jgi:hypothetical protein